MQWHPGCLALCLAPKQHAARATAAAGVSAERVRVGQWRPGQTFGEFSAATFNQCEWGSPEAMGGYTASGSSPTGTPREVACVPARCRHPPVPDLHCRLQLTGAAACREAPRVHRTWAKRLRQWHWPRECFTALPTLHV